MAVRIGDRIGEECKMTQDYSKVIEKEKYLTIDGDGDFVVTGTGVDGIIDSHIHMCNVLPLKAGDPERIGIEVDFPTLPKPEHLDLSTPYWTVPEGLDPMKGLLAPVKFSIEGWRIFKAMINMGTLQNCFRSQEKNGIEGSVVLPISTAKKDLSSEALETAAAYPDRLTPFCSVHPLTTQACR